MISTLKRAFVMTAFCIGLNLTPNEVLAQTPIVYEYQIVMSHNPNTIDGRIIFADSTGKNKEIILDKIFGVFGLKTDNVQKNLKKIANMINSMSRDGFELQNIANDN